MRIKKTFLTSVFVFAIILTGTLVSVPLSAAIPTLGALEKNALPGLHAQPADVRANWLVQAKLYAEYKRAGEPREAALYKACLAHVEASPFCRWVKIELPLAAPTLTEILIEEEPEDRS